MFFILILYAIIWGMSLLWALSLIEGNCHYEIMNKVFGITQIILYFSIIIFQWTR